MPLDPQQILFLGVPANAISARSCNFFDAFNVNEFQLIAWNAETFVADIQEKTGQSFQSYHHPFVYRRFKELYDEKLVEILSWIRSGNVLVIFPYLFDSGPETDGLNGGTNVNLNQFPPFNLVSLTRVSSSPLEVIENFSAEFCNVANILKHDVLLSGDNIVPLFRAGKNRQGPSAVAGAAFRLGKGAIIFSPPPKAWSDPRLGEYFEALAKLPGALSRPLDPLPERTGAFQRAALWLAALLVLLIAAVTFSPFWAPQVARLLPWGEKPPAAGQEYAALAARLTEIEKRPAPLGVDVEAIKSIENTLASRIDQLHTALSRPQEPSMARPTDAPATAAAPPTASPSLSTEEIAGLLARGDSLLRTGDVASARLFYERAARSGDGRAALRMGATFDPASLNQDVLRGVRGDPAEARLWYQRARDLGEAEAEHRLKSLELRRKGELP